MSDGPNGVRGESIGSKRTPGVAMFDLPWIAFRRWDVDHHSWVVEAGDYEIGPSLKHN